MKHFTSQRFWNKEARATDYKGTCAECIYIQTSQGRHSKHLSGGTTQSDAPQGRAGPGPEGSTETGSKILVPCLAMQAMQALRLKGGMLGDQNIMLPRITQRQGETLGGHKVLKDTWDSVAREVRGKPSELRNNAFKAICSQEISPKDVH